MEEPRLIKKSYRDYLKQKKVLITMSIFVLIVLIAPSYALLSNFKKSNEIVNVTTANMNMSVTQSSSITLVGKLPESDASGLQNATPVSIAVKNANTGPFTDTETTKFQNTNASTIKIVKYELKLITDTNQTSTLDNQYIKYAVSTDNGTTYSTPKKVSETNTIVFTGYNLDLGQTKNILLKIWVDEDSGSNGTGKNYYGSIQVEMYQNAEVPGVEVVKANIKSNNTMCQNATLTWTDPEDGITYISGSKTCVDFNYLWYSGKMWRITAIYPNGQMKLVTENNITSIDFGTNVNFYTDANTTSYVYQWLNEDFYDTLYNTSNIIDNSIQWNATNPSPDSYDIAVKPGNDTLITSNVGLLNSYEYYNSYRCNRSAACSSSTSSSGYLNIGYNWWLLNPYSSSAVRLVNYNGSDGRISPTYTNSVRPSINLKSEISLLGSGTKNDPYKIVGDKEQPIYNTTLINTRLSGEYVKIQYQENNENTLSPLYRIVGVDNNTTKIVMMEYLNNKETKPFATDNTGTTFGSGTTIDNTNKSTWYSYLNGSFNGNVSNEDGWFHSLGYKSLLTSGTYYMGNGGSSYNYKEAICASGDLNNTTKLCTKTSNTNTFNVGLLRYGELFATQQGTGYSNSIFMWLITKYSSSSVRGVSNLGVAGYYSPSDTYGVRPSINLKSEVKILGGSGTELDPFIVGM